MTDKIPEIGVMKFSEHNQILENKNTTLLMKYNYNIGDEDNKNDEDSKDEMKEMKEIEEYHEFKDCDFGKIGKEIGSFVRFIVLYEKQYFQHISNIPFFMCNIILTHYLPPLLNFDPKFQ